VVSVFGHNFIIDVKIVIISTPGSLLKFDFLSWLLFSVINSATLLKYVCDFFVRALELLSVKELLVSTSLVDTLLFLEH
jgi:hypothetical protein